MFKCNFSRLAACAAAALALLFVPAVRAQSAPGFAGAAALNAYIQRSMKDWKVPGVAVGIVRGAAPVYLRGFGVRDVRTGRPVTPDTLFDIGSCTKAFTAASIAMLVDEGKMSWEGRVESYIPFFHLYNPMADEYVTMRDLLTHRTGDPESGMLWYGSALSRDEIVRRIRYIKPSAGFRTTFQYNNLMFLAAGVAVGEVTHGTWDAFVKSRIFTPLGMSESDTSAVVAQQSPDFSAPHVPGPNGEPRAIPWRNIDNIGPAGSINSSVRDMAKWIALQLNNGEYGGQRLISARNVEAMHAPQMVIPVHGELGTVFFPDSMQLSYGLGWFIQDYRGHQLILHPGDIDGFSALVVLIPEIHTGYVVLINLGGGTYRQALGYHIADQLLGLSDAHWSRYFQNFQTRMEAAQKRARARRVGERHLGTHPSRALDAYTGTYQDPLYGRVRITLANGHLVL
ncbi:MAG: serine hydrolase, partial [Terriglobales bacterium]